MSQFSTLANSQSYALPNRKRANPSGGSTARSVRSRTVSSGVRKLGGRPKAKAVSTRSIKALVSSMIENRKEHKFTDDKENNWAVGQVNIDASGHHLFDVAWPIQGDGQSQRIGDRLKLLKIDFNFQYLNQNTGSQGVQDIHMTHFIVGFYGSDPTSDISQFLNRNECIFSANSGEIIYDQMSMRNQDYLGNVKVFGSFKTMMGRRSTTVASTLQNKVDQFSVDINKYIQFPDSDSVTPSNLQIAIISIADCGNTGNSSSTLTAVPVTASGTAARVYCSYRLTFTD